MVRAGWVPLALAISCAATSQDAILNDRVPRLAFHYTNGDTFELRHQNAFPRLFDSSRPHKIDDGTLTGRVCGVGLYFDAQWFGGTLTLIGQGDIPWRSYPHDGGPTSLTLGVSELAPGHRKISGQFGKHILPDATSPIVDLDVSADRMEGRVDGRQLSLSAQGDYLVGRIQQQSGVQPPVDAPFAIYGRNVLSTMAPADEALALVAMLTCDGHIVDHDTKPIRGFALAKLPNVPGPGDEVDEPVVEVDEPAARGVDGGAAESAPPEGTRTITSDDADATKKALIEYKNESAIVYLPTNPTSEMSAIADSLAGIFERAGLAVARQPWTLHSCQRPKYDLALVAHQPATALEMAIALRLTITKLRVYVCQSARTDNDKIKLLVLPRSN